MGACWLLLASCILPDASVRRDSVQTPQPIAKVDAAIDSAALDLDAGALKPASQDGSAGNADAAEVPGDLCAENNGGCDTLTFCATAKLRRYCGPCPKGYLGEGDDTCRPTLTGLVVSAGQLSPRLNDETTAYNASIPLTTPTITLTPAVPEGASVRVDGIQVEAGGSWASDVLPLGTTQLHLQVEQAGRPTREYTLSVERGRQTAYLKASNTRADANFAVVAISGDTLVVGARGESSAAIGVNNTSPGQSDSSSLRSGAAYVFVRRGEAWVQQAYLKASNTGEDDQFGHAVAISGNTLVIGAPHESSTAKGVNSPPTQSRAQWAGAAYVFTRFGDTWVQEAYLKASNPDGATTGSGDRFGWDVAIDGDSVVVGAPGESSAATGINNTDPGQSDNSLGDAGAAYIFVRKDGSWTQDAYVKPDRGGFRASFGWSVGLSGDTVVVGSYNTITTNTASVAPDAGAASAGVHTGAAYVFVRNAGTWSQQAELVAHNADEFDDFGHSIAISGDTVVVGAGNEDGARTRVDSTSSAPSDNLANGAGAAYVFVRADGRWSQQAYLKASNAEAGDWFNNVAIAGDMIVVGACNESSAATGINTRQPGPGDNSAASSGAAYVFGRKGTTWSQLAYLKASNAEADDRFCVVAASGDTVAVGGAYESSAAVGTSDAPPGQSDNTTEHGGAVYVFR